MAISIFNTQTGKKTPLTPLESNHVKMYVCGITAYDYCHIGHARSTLVFDMITKYLRYRGFKITYVRNFTDIDDKIINRANEQGTTSEALASRFIDAFNEDMARLDVDKPDFEPKATEYIPEIIALISSLIEKGLAYRMDDDVYFAIEKFNGYGKLSGRSLEEMKAGARVSINERKHNPMDFALWKGSKPGEPTWDSPWGPGRPGWHIECSAMSKKLLGPSFDIHGGGKDLVFPHHENEIAQSEGASGQNFVGIWIHHGFVTIKEEKMSKSLGNFLTIREVLEKHAPEVLRFFVFSTHYRNPLDYSDTALQDATTGLDRLYGCLAAIDRLPPPQTAIGQLVIATAEEKDKVAAIDERFIAVMDNDFNTAQGLAVLFEAIKTLNRIRLGLPEAPASDDIALLREGADKVRTLGRIMGLLREDPAQYIEKKRTAGLDDLAIDATLVEQLIVARKEAREKKDWARADAIRNQLISMHVELKDGPEGTTWSVRRQGVAP